MAGETLSYLIQEARAVVGRFDEIGTSLLTTIRTTDSRETIEAVKTAADQIPDISRSLRMIGLELRAQSLRAERDRLLADPELDIWSNATRYQRWKKALDQAESQLAETIEQSQRNVPIDDPEGG